MTDPAKTNAVAGGAAGVVDEFAHIPRLRTRHPIIAAAGALLAFFLVFHVRHDLRYALSSSVPLELGSARQSFGSGKVGNDVDNRYVRLSGIPDRESALEIDTKGSWVFSQFFRVLGTGDRLFLHRRESPLPASRAEADVFEGRLIRFDELSFADAIRAYFGRHVTATHFFAPEAFARAVAGRAARRASGDGAVALADRTGDSVSLGGDEAISVEVVEPDQVQLGLPRARFATEPEARTAITSRGGEVLASRGLAKGVSASGPESGPMSAAPPPPERWVFVARFAPARRQAALDELGDVDRLVEIRDARETVTARLADIAAVGDGLVVHPAGAPERRLGAAEIAAVRTLAPVVISPDAFLLVEGDQPREHLATIFFALMLVMFGTVNLMGLIKNRDRGRP